MTKHVTVNNILGWGTQEVNYLDVLFEWAIDVLGSELSDIEIYLFDALLDRRASDSWITAAMHEIQVTVAEEMPNYLQDVLNTFSEDMGVTETEREALQAYATYNMYLLGRHQKHDILGAGSYFNNILDDCMGTDVGNCTYYMVQEGLKVIRNEY